MTYRIYLRSHAQNEQGRIIERHEPTANPNIAEKAYRRFLARDDLDGQPVAAVVSRDRKSIYFSRFDDPTQRIHPDAPLNMMADQDLTFEAVSWEPPEFILPTNPTPQELRAARESLGLTQEKMAPLLGYGRRESVTEIESENRKYDPSDTVIRLLRAYLEGYRPSDWPS